MDNTIVRDPTPEETKGPDSFKPLATKKKERIKEPTSIFKAKLALEEQKATKKGLPFAAIVAENEFKDELKRQEVEQKRLYGSVVEIKVPKINWAKYSDLKNFEFIKEGDVHDEFLSKRYNMLVYIKKKEYKYKGYGNIYRVMEDQFSAIKRAKELQQA